MTSDMERDVHYRLIKAVEQFPVLYDFSLADYSNKVISDKAWNEVAKKVNSTVGECKEKWRNIRSSYSRSKKAGPKGSRPKKTYYLAKHLIFIEPFLKTRDYTTNKEEEDEEKSIPESDTQSQHCIYFDDEEDDVSVEYKEENTIPALEASTAPLIKRRTEQIDPTEYVPRAKENRKEPKSMSTQKHPMHYFFLSLLDEFNTMSESQMRQFKIKVLQLIDEIKSQRPRGAIGASSPESYVTGPSSTSMAFVECQVRNTEDMDAYVRDKVIKMEHDVDI